MLKKGHMSCIPSQTDIIICCFYCLSVCVCVFLLLFFTHFDYGYHSEVCRTLGFLFRFCDCHFYLPWVPATILLGYLLSLLSCPDAAGSCINCTTQRLRLWQHHHHIWLDCEFCLRRQLFLCVHLFFVWALGWGVVVLEHVGTGVTVLLNEQWFEVHALVFKFKSCLETAPISSMSKQYKSKISAVYVNGWRLHPVNSLELSFRVSVHHCYCFSCYCYTCVSWLLSVFETVCTCVCACARLIL